MKKDQIVADESTEIISDTPVWVAITLKKPLEKFHASVVDTTICDTDVIEKSELILMKFQHKPKSVHHEQKSSIVPKTVTHEGAEEQLKFLNEVFGGPWKGLRVSPGELLKEKSLYSLEKTLHYLVRCHMRQEMLDNTLETCQLCGKEFKHMAMGRHQTRFCKMREEPCQ